MDDTDKVTTLEEEESINSKEDITTVRSLPCKQCRRLRQTTRNFTVSDLAIAQDIARCLHEFKYNLIHNVVQVLGVHTALELFYETTKIQRNGGRMVGEEKRKKEPGGVFLMLVKERATDDQKQMIFQKEKERHHLKKKVKKARKRKEKTGQDKHEVVTNDNEKEREEKEEDQVEKMETEESSVGVSVGVSIGGDILNTVDYEHINEYEFDSC